MSLIDDMERLAAEPPAQRRRRRVGALFVALGVVMCLAGLFGARWWTIEYSWGSFAVGLTESEACADEDCESLKEVDVVRICAGHRGQGREDLAAVEDWLGTRTPAAASLIVLCVVGAVLVLCSALTPAHRRARALALLGIGLVAITVICLARFMLEAPVDVMSRGTHALLVFAALADLLIGFVLVATSSARSTPVVVAP